MGKRLHLLAIFKTNISSALYSLEACQLLESHLALYLDLGGGSLSMCMCVKKKIIKHTGMIWALHSMLVIGQLETINA